MTNWLNGVQQAAEEFRAVQPASADRKTRHGSAVEVSREVCRRRVYVQTDADDDELRDITPDRAFRENPPQFALRRHEIVGPLHADLFL